MTNQKPDALALMTNALQALAEATTVQEVHHLIGMAKAAEVYARQVEKSKLLVFQATEFRIRAERRLGEMLAATDLSKGGRPPQTGRAEQPVSATLRALGITKDVSSRAQQIAMIPGEEFEAIVEASRADGELIISRVLKSKRREERREARVGGIDFFPTPAWCVHRLLESVDLPSGRWIEPCAGEGAIVRAVNAVRSDVTWTTTDIRKGLGVDHVADFTLLEGDQPWWPDHFDVAITNPPFISALEVVQAALRYANIVVMLLRLNWLASADRADWLRANTPTKVLVLPDRPSFDGEGTDATDYAWMIWDGGGDGHHATLSILETTPLEERRSK